MPNEYVTCRNKISEDARTLWKYVVEPPIVNQGSTAPGEARITKGPAYTFSPYRASTKAGELKKQEVKRIFIEDVIGPSQTECASPLLFVPKRNMAHLAPASAIEIIVQ